MVRVQCSECTVHTNTTNQTPPTSFDPDNDILRGVIDMIVHVVNCIQFGLIQIRYILADEDDDKEAIELGKRPLFTQMDVLCHFDDGKMGWKEVSRYKQYY
jgi:hypothetical protein